MKIIDKLKDLFTDEEEVIEDKEISVEEDKEHKLPTFMREKIAKEEQKKKDVVEPKMEHQSDIEYQPKREDNLIHKKEEYTKKAETEKSISDRELIDTKQNRFRFPISLEEQDYNPSSNQNIIKKIQEKPKSVKELYADKKTKKEEINKFHATPIISPVYGVLDKNYKKDELKAKKEETYAIPRPSVTKTVDFEMVRKKAFGNLTDEIKDNMLCEKCELYNHFKEVSKPEKLKEDDLLYDITKEDNLTIEEAAENYYDFGVSYENNNANENNNVTVETSEIKIINHNDEVTEAEKIEVKEKIILDKSKQGDGIETSKVEENLELTDDLFNLIDSMYKEKEEDE